MPIAKLRFLLWPWNGAMTPRCQQNAAYLRMTNALGEEEVNVEGQGREEPVHTDFLKYGRRAQVDH
jgi:hypothetical protein